MFEDFLASIKSIIGISGGFLFSFFWVFLLPIILLLLIKDLWLKQAREKFIKEIEWALLEIIPPRDIKKTPYAMEQFFAGLHGIHSTPNWSERNIDGKFQDWFSLELVSISGQTHFFIRTISRYRDLVEAQIYAQYPEAEIFETDDYVNSAPADIPNKDFDLWGTELVLVKEDAYPIRTYPVWEKELLVEEQRIDPIASLLEVMSRLHQGEQIWIQILIRPVDDKWKKQGEVLRDKLIGRKAKKSSGVIAQEIAAWFESARGVSHQIITGESDEIGWEKTEEKPVDPTKLTKAEQEVVQAIENNIAKIGYDVIIRFLYLGPNNIFNKANVSAIIGCFKQFNTQNLNGLKPNSQISTRLDYKIQLKKIREPYRKRKVFEAYKKRAFAQYSKAIFYLKPLFYERLPIVRNFLLKSKPFVFNIEELASVYHFPGLMVKAPMVPRVEAKKGEPPMGLPVG